MCLDARKLVSQALFETARVVKGVGKGSQSATYQVTLATATDDVEGGNVEDELTAPCLENSAVPGLLGIKALKAKGALVRCKTGEMWWLGPGGAEINISPGSRHFQMKEAPSGHWLLPISAFRRPKRCWKTGTLFMDDDAGDLRPNDRGGGSSGDADGHDRPPAGGAAAGR